MPTTAIIRTLRRIQVVDNGAARGVSTSSFLSVTDLLIRSRRRTPAQNARPTFEDLATAAWSWTWSVSRVRWTATARGGIDQSGAVVSGQAGRER